MSAKIDALVRELLKEDVPLILAWNKKLQVFLVAELVIDPEDGDGEKLEYQVSDGLPGDRTESQDFITFDEAQTAFDARCASEQPRQRGWGDWGAFRKRYTRTFICWAEPPPCDPSEERYAIMKSDDRPGAYVIWARVSPNPDVPFDRSSGGFFTVPEEGKKAIPWAVEAAMAHKREMRVWRGPPPDEVGEDGEPR